MSAAGLANPAPAARSLSREIERVDNEAWELLLRHIKRCQLCAGKKGSDDLCSLGSLLRHAWHEVRTLQREPSRWSVVEVLAK